MRWYALACMLLAAVLFMVASTISQEAQNKETQNQKVQQLADEQSPSSDTLKKETPKSAGENSRRLSGEKFSQTAPARSSPEDSAGDNKDNSGSAERQAWAENLAASIAIFVLAIFVGFEVITKVPPTLHTPLMSGSNAISGITIVGALVIAGTALFAVEPLIGFAAVILATINVVGGFLVTHRMLMMFKKK